MKSLRLNLLLRAHRGFFPQSKEKKLIPYEMLNEKMKNGK